MKVNLDRLKINTCLRRKVIFGWLFYLLVATLEKLLET
uniref:Uncharacterized protein n=1 Tax=Rhizophora mucronata TaxID=61149 RepID=A0A2P2NW72_RHIMU